MNTKKIIDTKIPLPKAFIKFGKKVHMESYINNGELRFAPIIEFSKMIEGKEMIADKYEGNLFYSATKIYIAPIVSMDDNGNDIYGKPLKLAENAELRLTNDRIQKIPIHCLYCYNNQPLNAIVQLENYNQIIKEFPDYDTAVIIYNTKEFLDRINRKFETYANYVKYIDKTPSESEISNSIHYLYYKREKYNKQSEFRISLPAKAKEKAEIYNIGSLRDIAYYVPLNELKNGIIIANNKNAFNELINKCKERGINVKINN